jgi:hypothetical protein
MDAPQNFASLLFPALGLMAAVIVLAWRRPWGAGTAHRSPPLRPGDEVSAEQRRLRSPKALDRVQLRLHRLEGDLERPLRERMQLLDRLIRLGDDEIARLRERLADNTRRAAAVTPPHRQPDLILGHDTDRAPPAELPAERRWKKAA